MSVKGKVAFNGRFVKTEDIQRGQAILYTPEEWCRRGRETMSEVLRWQVIAFTFSVVPVWLLFIALVGTVNAFILAWPPVYCLLMISTFQILSKYQQDRELERGNFTGLFEHGLQYRVPFGPDFRFYPYSEIEKVRVDDTWPFPKLVLRLRGFKRPVKAIHAPTTLGEAGLGLLDRMVSEGPRTEGPPRLVLYGGSGARLEVSKASNGGDAVLPVFDVRSQL